MSLHQEKSLRLSKRNKQRNVFSVSGGLEHYSHEGNLFRRLSHLNLAGNNYNDGGSGVFYEDFKPIFNLLRLMGVLPLQKNKSGELQYRPVSLVMLYSVAVYAAMLWALWVAHGHEVNSNQYDDSIVALYHLMFLLLVVVVPFTNWKDAPVLAQYVSSWLRFQTEFRRVTAQTLSLSLRKRAWCLALLVPAASLSLECCYQLLDTSINLVQLVTDVYLLVLRVLLTVVWHFCCRALCKAAEDTLHSFRKELVSVTVSHAVWAEYRILWLSLAKLTRQTGVATCFTFGFFILYMFTKLTLNVYWTINALLFAPTRFFVVAYICITIVNDMILMYVICDNAQTVQSRVGDAFKDTLMDYRTHGIKDSVQDEVLAFLQVIDSCPPVLNLGNFVIVSRRLLISLGSVMVTYLVVLLQFKVSHLSTGKVNNSTSSHNYTNKYG